MRQHSSPGFESSTRLQHCVEHVSCSNMRFVYVFVHKCSTCVAFTAAEGASHMPRFHTLGHLFYPLTQHYSTWKFHLSGAHVCFFGPLCKHRFMAACEDKSYAWPHPTAPHLIHFPSQVIWLGNHFSPGMFFAYGHCKMVVTEIEKGLVDQALYSKSDQSIQGRDLPVRGAAHTTQS